MSVLFGSSCEHYLFIKRRFHIWFSFFQKWFVFEHIIFQIKGLRLWAKGLFESICNLFKKKKRLFSQIGLSCVQKWILRKWIFQHRMKAVTLILFGSSWEPFFVSWRRIFSHCFFLKTRFFEHGFSKNRIKAMTKKIFFGSNCEHFCF